MAEGERTNKRRRRLRLPWLWGLAGDLLVIGGVIAVAAASALLYFDVDFVVVPRWQCYVAIAGGLAAVGGGVSLILRAYPRRIRRVSLGRGLALLVVYGASLAAAVFYYAVSVINEDLPRDLTKLLDYQPSRKSTVLSSDGEEIGTFSIENRHIVPLERIPSHVVAAFLSAEDHRFYEHVGFDPVGIARAAWKNWRADDHIKQGGSTITQQIIKNTLLVGTEGDVSDLGLPDDRLRRLQKLMKYTRKMREIVLAVRLERELTKPDILAIYLNHIYLGHGAYGIGAAAQSYFGKEVEDLTLAEAALLAGVVTRPTEWAPHVSIEKARMRQKYVLRSMLEYNYISEAEYQAALAEPIALVDKSDLNHLASPYFVEHIRQTATKKYGNGELFKGGLRFYSTLDTHVQAAAENALKHGLEALDRKLGFRGPIGTVPQDKRGAWSGGGGHPLSGANDDVSAVADELLPEQRYGVMVVELPKTGVGVTVDLGPKRLPLADADARDVRAWRSKAGEQVRLGDLLAVRLAADGNAAVLAQRPALQGAIVVMDPRTGQVKALVGGYDWVGSQFDRATQARRSVGSSIKPFIYSAALEAGKTPVDHMHDGPVTWQTATGAWTPANYDNKYLGDVTLMTALAFSLNTISVQIAMQVGLDRIIEILRGYGIASPIQRVPSLSLGVTELTLLELSGGYAGIASGGRRVTPRFYDLVTDTTGHVVDEPRAAPPGPQVISPDVDFVLVNMMKGVVQRGTARYALALGRPTAGKTGTSANYKDVWFNGFTTDLLCSVWIGRDDGSPIGDKITGGGAAVPIWLELMQKAHPRTKVRDFTAPPGVTFARVEPWGGEPAYPSSEAVWMPFVAGTLPRPFLSALPVMSFEQLVPAPPVPRAPAVCRSLSCL